ncbi:MAG: hypothetical protein A2Y80_09850 [Deltaproteobacteria bacterium RBG_13_58_19]|jgi:hypothetical protein|nr:MAG: hypothetical protein A2Y80_09850 [Deltaproteobacteria bacterium RBG_13_58_19]
MKRMVLLILVLLLLMDVAEDGCLGKAKVYLPHPSAKTTFTSSHNHPDFAQIDFRHKLAFTDLPGSRCHGNGQPVILRLPITLQIMHCCHLSSSGGIPL